MNLVCFVTVDIFRRIIFFLGACECPCMPVPKMRLGPHLHDRCMIAKTAELQFSS